LKICSSAQEKIADSAKQHQGRDLIFKFVHKYLVKRSRVQAVALPSANVCEKLLLCSSSNIIYIWNIKARKVVYLMMQHITEFHAISFFF
jgi:hypothetical protein